MRSRLVLSTLALAFAVGLVWLAVRTARQNDRIAQLEEQLRAAQAIVPASGPTTEPAAPPPSQPVHEEREPRPITGPVTSPEVEQLRARLDDANSALARVQAQVNELALQLQEITSERNRLGAAESEARAQVAELSRRIEAIDAERPPLEKRIRDLETDNVRLRELNVGADQKSAQFSKLAGELQELARRQQVYLTNALRRYREVTDLFRSLPGMLEIRGNGPEVSRIQSAISMADEDLRQVNELNVRAGRVQKQLAAVR
jgi:DNA repair exonuclease SbcCD ATPase subunit